MLGAVALVEHFREIESRLPEDWADARLVLTVDDASRAERASAILASFAPGRLGTQVRFSVPRGGGRLDQMRRLLRQLDREGIRGRLELVTSAQRSPEAPAPRIAWRPAAEAWDAALMALPEDWSDLYVQVDLASSDFLERGALLLGPVNPARYGRRSGMRPARTGRTSAGRGAPLRRRCR